jgi:hypothetical protein
MKAAGEQHVVRIDVIAGKVNEKGGYSRGGDSFNKLQDAKVKTSMDALRRLAKDNESETYMITTLRWLAWE